LNVLGWLLLIDVNSAHRDAQRHYASNPHAKLSQRKFPSCWGSGNCGSGSKIVQFATTSIRELAFFRCQRCGGLENSPRPSFREQMPKEISETNRRRRINDAGYKSEI